MIIICPNCNESIIIEEINCGIFRHGVFKTNGIQMDPHSTKNVCDEAIEKDLIYGCGKPFQIIIQDNTTIIQKCDYI